MKKFDEDELKKFNGSTPGTPIYFAYNGKVYDATDNPLFTDGMHFEHFAGTDLSDYIEDAPHDGSVMDALTVVGDYEE